MKHWSFTTRSGSRLVVDVVETVAESFGVPVTTMDVGDTFTDKDGDTWERTE